MPSTRFDCQYGGVGQSVCAASKVSNYHKGMAKVDIYPVAILTNIALFPCNLTPGVRLARPQYRTLARDLIASPTCDCCIHGMAPGGAYRCLGALLKPITTRMRHAECKHHTNSSYSSCRKLTVD